MKGQGLYSAWGVIGWDICGPWGTASWAGFLGSGPKDGHYSRKVSPKVGLK